MAKENDLSFLNDDNITAELLLFSDRIELASSIIFTIISIVGITANGLVVFHVVWQKALRTKNNFFIANLAAADTILFLVLITPTDINAFTEIKVFQTKPSMVATQYIQHVCIQATALILVSMSFSRYTTSVFPLKAKTMWTTFRVWTCCAVSWIVSTFIYLPILCGILYYEQSEYYRKDTKVFAAIAMLLLFIIPFSLIVFCYTGIIISFQKGRYKMRKNSNIDPDTSSHQSRKLTRMVLIIIIVFFVSWAPVQSYLTWLNCREHNLPTSPANWRHIDIFGFCSRLPAYLGGAINPFIYAYTSPSFTKSNLFRRRKKSQSTTKTAK